MSQAICSRIANLFLLLLLEISLPSFLWAGNEEIDYVSPSSEDQGVSPEFLASYLDLWVVVENYDKELHVLDRGLNVFVSLSLENIGEVVDLKTANGSIIVVNTDGSEFDITPSAFAPRGSSGEAVQSEIQPVESRVGFVYEEDGTLSVSVSNEALLGLRGVAESQNLSSLEFSLEPISSGDSELVDWRPLNRLETGEVILLWTERQRAGGFEFARFFVGRFGSDGLEAGFEVPAWESENVGSVPVAVSSTGNAKFLMIDRGINLVTMTFQPVGAFLTAAQSEDRLNEILDGYFGDIQGSAVPEIAKPPLPKTTRVQMLVTAEKYLKNITFLSSRNLGLSLDFGCRGESRHLRPRKLENAVGGSVIGGVPYAWGKYDSISGYREKVASGSLAGDICTNFRYGELNGGGTCSGNCVIKESAGVDCSGFVTRVWGIGSQKYGTSTLSQISSKLESKSELRPGDILLKAGSHVYIFLAVGKDKPIRFQVIDASVSKGGVAQRVLRETNLAGYLPYRYDAVQE
ncbi:hypothetical protein [Ruegeria sp. HKCCA0370]|uniref:hypothetical protein n=1 Tax=Ruegeria sp. HKCCA0370 TaxID=2682995 RepID=UPI001489A9D0|nr:hypothetical protein [Ruegeria sp. HKCCA0370]